MVFSYLQEQRKTGSKTLAVLVDPDDSETAVRNVAEMALMHGVELFLVGGSIVTRGNTQNCVEQLKNLGARYVVLFPGNEIQVVNNADAILFMSLVSGRNPEFLIGKQVNAAAWVRKAGLETIPTAYMIVESGKMTSALYMSQSLPLPSDKPDIAAATAIASEMLGMRAFYLDAGSGAENPVKTNMIKKVRNSISGVIFIGGGIRNAPAAEKAWTAGADVVVIGNGVFEDPGILKEISAVCNKLNTTRQEF
ncbi:MAG: geranylgeranylglyceryl/heptaprenylglyceryl phosphate synthase [Bacteroidetes bacterium]|nr:geranylgeranylglyceryl/heptaprenylglyceryl phosphate synthase [Bacteroidota bacterium]